MSLKQNGIYNEIEYEYPSDCPGGHVHTSNCRRNGCPCETHDHELMLIEFRKDEEANNGENEFLGR